MTAAHALLSALAERAVVFDGTAWWEVHPDRAEPRKADRRASAALCGLYADVELLPAEPHPFPRLRARLVHAAAVERTLVFVTDVLDSSRGDLRTRAAGLAERRLRDAAVADVVEVRLLSRRLPGDADVPGALRIAEDSPLLAALLDRVERAQPRITGVLDALDDVLGGEPLAARSGLADAFGVRDAAGRIVAALVRDHPEQAGAWVFTSGLDPRALVVAQAWVKRVLAADADARDQRRRSSP